MSFKHMHHYVTEDSNQHNYTVERHNNITIVLSTHNTLTFSRNISDSGEEHQVRPVIFPDPAPFWLVVARRTWETLVCATERHVVLCRYSEHRLNVGCLCISRKCVLRSMSPKSDGGGHTFENRGVETYAYTTSHTFYPTRPASGCHAIRFCPKTSSRRRMGATLNSLQRVESRWYN